MVAPFVSSGEDAAERVSGDALESHPWRFLARKSFDKPSVPLTNVGRCAELLKRLTFPTQAWYYQLARNRLLGRVGLGFRPVGRQPLPNPVLGSLRQQWQQIAVRSPCSH